MFVVTSNKKNTVYESLVMVNSFAQHKMRVLAVMEKGGSRV